MTQFSWTRVWACAQKEYRHITRDWSIGLVAIALPILLMILFGQALNLDPGHMKMILTHPEPDGHVSPLLAPFQFSSSFADIELSSIEDSQSHLMLGNVRAVMMRPAPQEINIVCDASDPNTANMLNSTIISVFSNDQLQNALENSLPLPQKITPSVRTFYNESQQTQWALVPGSIAVIMTLVTTLLTALVLAKEWERGTMESLWSTELQPLELFIGKWIPYAVVSSLVFSFCVFMAVNIYQVPLRGSVFSLFAIMIFFIFTTLNLGLWISATLKDQFLCAQVALMTAYMPSFMLSGFLFEVRSMPFFTQSLSALVPASYFVPELQTFFLVGDRWDLFVSNVMILLLMGLFFLVRAVATLSSRTFMT